MLTEGIQDLERKRLWLCLSFRLKAIRVSDERWIRIFAKNTKGPVVAHRALQSYQLFTLSALSPQDSALSLVHPFHAAAVAVSAWAAG